MAETSRKHGSEVKRQERVEVRFNGDRITSDGGFVCSASSIGSWACGSALQISL